MARRIGGTPELSAERRAELEVSLQKMTAAKDTFYRLAMDAHCHAFVEFAGVMHQYIQSCREALDKGIDFAFVNKHNGNSLPLPDHGAAYLGEKIGCIWAGALNDPEKFYAFRQAMLDA